MKSNEQHYYQLDILRAVAILLVFSFHWYGISFGADHFAWKGWWRDWSSAPNSLFLWLYPLSFGWVGVSLFFVISGFCIHFGWASGKQLTTGQFYWRRFWRIVPPYWIILIFFFWRSWRAETVTIGDFISHFFFIHNLNSDWFFGVSQSFWSLAVEVQFYLIYPLLLLWLKRWSIEKILWTSLAMGIAGRIIPTLLFQKISDDPVFFSNTWVLWFDWLLGAAIAERIGSGKLLFQHPVRWLGICGAAFLFATQFLPLAMFSFSLASVCAAVCVEQCLLHPPNLHRHVNRMLTFLGICSYSFYLLHQRILDSIVYLWPSKTFLGHIEAGFFALVVVTILSGLSYWFLEKTSLRIGKHWGYRLFPGKKQTSLDLAPEKIGLPI